VDTEVFVGFKEVLVGPEQCRPTRPSWLDMSAFGDGKYSIVYSSAVDEGNYLALNNREASGLLFIFMYKWQPSPSLSACMQIYNTSQMYTLIK